MYDIPFLPILGIATNTTIAEVGPTTVSEVDSLVSPSLACQVEYPMYLTAGHSIHISETCDIGLREISDQSKGELTSPCHFITVSREYKDIPPPLIEDPDSVEEDSLYLMNDRPDEKFDTPFVPKESIDWDEDILIFPMELTPDNELQDEIELEAYTVYKRIAQKIHPVSGTFPEESRVHHRFLHNPLDSLLTLTSNPPVFIPTERLTLENMKILNVNPDGFLWPEEEKNYSQLARPLTELICKNANFEWTNRCQNSFDTLKELVSSAPALRPIDYASDKPVILSVDTSYIAVGFILSQIDENDHRRPASLHVWHLYLIGVTNLVVEMDANSVKGIINNPDIQPNHAMN
ncbi:hypothetical protein Hypma_008178 [Hypsizygus marmoreus]|uniref:Reverse transcriptase/retrotransposon-derived protein RNase H-like domain-containing protein n=1 Tax=Hypsizygus marmoreus TaxID=39966 RepID=A0A369JVW1_HYPMA|nr:hypothetical protein Hypma_008178 [Hypsizygus marmoreus]